MNAITSNISSPGSQKAMEPAASPPSTCSPAQQEDAQERASKQEASEEEVSEQESEPEQKELRCCECCKRTETIDFTDGECGYCGHELCEDCGPVIFMDCCQCNYLTEIEGDRCDYHGHDFCNDCGRWDPSVDNAPYIGYDDKSYDDDEIGDPERVYCIENTEANKVARIPFADLIMSGPVLKPDAEAVLQRLPIELKIKIVGDVVVHYDPQEVRAIWNHFEDRWTYRCFAPVNKIPSLAAKSMDQQALTHFYNPAPKLSRLPAFKYFNYNKDWLVIDYQRCGNDRNDYQEYCRAIKLAIKKIVKHHENPNSRGLKFLKLTYCPPEEDLKSILRSLDPVRSLQKVILEPHFHYEDPMVGYNGRNRIQGEEQAMQYIVNDGDHLGHHFTVELRNHWGVAYEVEGKSDDEN